MTEWTLVICQYLLTLMIFYYMGTVGKNQRVACGIIKKYIDLVFVPGPCIELLKHLEFPD